MNIVDFWKSLASNAHSAKDFDGDDFISKLNENVPDWKQQVKDRNLWPDLHSYSNNVNETVYTSVIIEEAGPDFAFYLVNNQWGKRHLDAALALDHCCGYFHLWDSFPDNVKEKVLEFQLRDFLEECLQNVSMWQSLTEKQKEGIFDCLARNEERYLSDTILFKIWAEELDYKESPYVVFDTDHFRDVARLIVQNKNRDNHLVERHLQKWDIPTVFMMHNRLRYNPSEKLSLLQDVAEASGDTASINVIDRIIRKSHARLRQL